MPQEEKQIKQKEGYFSGKPMPLLIAKPAPNHATATNILSQGLAYVHSSTERADKRIFPLPYSCTHYSVALDNIYDNFMSSKDQGNALDTIIADTLAQRYEVSSSLSNMIAPIKERIYRVIGWSMDALATIMCLKRMQDCRNYRDRNGYDIAAVLNNQVERAVAEQEGQVSIKTGNFTISNAEWKDLLSKVSNCFLSDSMISNFAFLFGHNFRLAREDATVRFINFLPDRQYHTSAEGQRLNWADKAAVIASIEGALNAINNVLNEYNIIPAILNKIGLFAHKKLPDMTRDLGGTDLNDYYDEHGLIESMVYSTVDHASNNTFKVAGTEDGIISVPTPNFKLSNDLNWDERIEAKISTLTNVLRNQVLTILNHSVCVVDTDLENATVQVKIMAYYGYYCEISAEALSDLSKEQLNNINNSNRILGLTDAVGAPYAMQVYPGGELKYAMYPGLADYAYSSGDVEVIREYATADLLFGKQLVALLNQPVESNTINLENVL